MEGEGAEIGMPYCPFEIEGAGKRPPPEELGSLTGSTMNGDGVEITPICGDRSAESADGAICGAERITGSGTRRVANAGRPRQRINNGMATAAAKTSAHTVF